MRALKALSKPIEFCGKHPFATGMFAILSVMGLFLSITGFKLDRLESEIASQQVLEVQKNIASVDEKIESVSKARKQVQEANEFATNATESAHRQFLASNANALRLSRYLLTFDIDLGAVSVAYFFEPEKVINNLDRRRVSLSQNSDPYFWGVCPYSLIECYRDIKLEASVRPQAIIQSSTKTHHVHANSLNAFLKVCKKFDSFILGDLGFELCNLKLDASEIQINAGETIRFAGTPGDVVLVLFAADGKRGVHFGSNGSSYPFNIWLRDKNGRYSRVDDRTASMQENNQHWIGGDYIAIIMDVEGLPIEVVSWDGYGNRAQIQNGASIKRFKLSTNASVLKQDMGLTFRTNRTDEKGANGLLLPDVLEVCVERNGEFDC